MVLEFRPDYGETSFNFTIDVMVMAFPIDGFGLSRFELWVSFEEFSRPTWTTWLGGMIVKGN
jgi:hypothetical protein